MNFPELQNQMNATSKNKNSGISPAVHLQTQIKPLMFDHFLSSQAISSVDSDKVNTFCIRCKIECYLCIFRRYTIDHFSCYIGNADLAGNDVTCIDDHLSWSWVRTDAHLHFVRDRRKTN